MIIKHKVSFAFVDNGVYSMSSEGLQILEETRGQVSSRSGVWDCYEGPNRQMTGSYIVFSNKSFPRFFFCF